jgi:tripartite-type tricarboxylate transporter receptor subunit TctC
MRSASRRSLLQAAFLAVACSVLAFPGLSQAQAQAQAWPARPIKLVVPFPPGGGTDVAARIIGERLSARLGQPVIIDNKPGASTAIGVVMVSAAEPDGYTLLFSGSTSYTVNPAVRSKLGYDPFKQLSPIAMVARTPLVLVTASTGPYKTLKDVLAKAKAAPGTLTNATFGAGSAPHLAGSLPNDVFADLLGLPTLWVPHSYPACAQHAPDEHLLAPVAREGLRIMAGLYWDLGEPAGLPWHAAPAAA